MLLIRRRQITVEQELNMPAMVDIVFLLLIFFMCTSSLSTSEQSLDSLIARPVSSRSSVPEDSRPVRITVIGGPEHAVYKINGQPVRNYHSLSDQLERRRELQDISVIIEGQNNLAFQYMVEVMDTCYRVGITRVAFSTKGVQ